MTEEELRAALDQYKIVHLKPEGRPLSLSPQAEALALIDRAVHSARTAGFELVGPLEATPDRIAAALKSASDDLLAAIVHVHRIGAKP